MSKRVRQYLGLALAVFAYYLIHEGAHLAYALVTGTFRQINFMGLGIQIDVFAENMTDVQLGLFCLAGPMATLMTAWLLNGFTGMVVQSKSKVFRACVYYITIAMLFLDPVYLCGIYKLVGGGDMNGIALLLPEPVVQIVCGVLLLAHVIVFRNWILPKYKKSYEGEETE